MVERDDVQRGVDRARRHVFSADEGPFSLPAEQPRSRRLSDGRVNLDYRDRGKGI